MTNTPMISQSGQTCTQYYHLNPPGTPKQRKQETLRAYFYLATLNSAPISRTLTQILTGLLNSTTSSVVHIAITNTMALFMKIKSPYHQMSWSSFRKTALLGRSIASEKTTNSHPLIASSILEAGGVLYRSFNIHIIHIHKKSINSMKGYLSSNCGIK